MILTLNICYSQINIDSIIDSKYSIIKNKILQEIVSDKIINENFKQKRKLIRLKVYNKEKGRYQIVNLKAFKRLGYDFIEIAIIYEIVTNGKILTYLRFPFDNFRMLFHVGEIRDALKPYLLVLEDKIEINLDDAIEIAKKNGFNEIFSWKIYFEKRKLIWLIKEKLENKKIRIIKINSKNGKILSDYINKKG